MNKGRLFLIPVTLGDTPASDVLPEKNLQIVRNIRYFIAEEEKNAFRFLKKCNYALKEVQPEIMLLNEHTREIRSEDYLSHALNGEDTGLLSDAGVPCVADPGSAIVRMAHESGIRVIPLTGPSSVILALMASGLNGQNFCFHGYLPVDKKQRTDRLRKLEQWSASLNQTQIFIETPYRNNRLMEDVITACRPGTMLCIAANLSLVDEYILTREISRWKGHLPDLNRKPAVFLIQA